MPILSRARRLPGAARAAFAALPLLAVLGGERAGAQQAESDGDLLVLAASSLQDVLPAVGTAWLERGGAPVRFSFAATSRIAPQALQARGDVFFSADWSWMQWLRARGAVREGSVRDILGNELVVVVPAGEPPPRDPADLAALSPLALAGENVPAGRYGREALEAEGQWEAVRDQVVRGGSVRGALEWVARGEAAAGIVYRTDALVEPRVEIAFSFAPEGHQPIRYPAAVLESSDRTELARAFLEFAAGPVAEEIYRQAGFRVGPPGDVTFLPPAAAATPGVWSAIRLSLLVALLATVAGLVPAVALGWVMARRDFPGKTLLSTVVLAPLVVPPVVTGFLLLSVLGSQTLVGGWLAGLGIPVPFTLLGAAVAAFVVGLPLYVISVRGAFEAVDPHYEEVSWTLGSPPRKTFFRVTLPLAVPGIAAGAVLAFARALGEFGATVVLAGNVEGSTRTIALAVYTLLESPAGGDATWVLVAASVALSLAALLGFEALSRRQRNRLEDRHGR